MASIKSRIILYLLKNRHIFKFRLHQKPFDASLAGIVQLRKQTEKASALFGRLAEDIEITPVAVRDHYAEWMRIPTADRNNAILYFHGGMYALGSAQSHRQHVAKFVRGSNINALTFNYRLAPEYPFPAALDDALEAYQYLLDQGFAPARIVFAGDSAGGGLCLATLLAIKDAGKQMPAAAAVLSPWTDLMLTGESYTRNRKKCLSPQGSAEHCSNLYAGKSDKREPRISPLYGNLKGLPPLHISAGGNEILLDDARLFASKAIESGVQVTLLIGESMCHCFPALSGLFPEADAAMAEICRHLKDHIL